jgi:hypothetical protein
MFKNPVIMGITIVKCRVIIRYLISRRDLLTFILFIWEDAEIRDELCCMCHP